MDTKRFQIISDIMKLISIKSFTHDDIGIRKCQDFLMELSEKLGFKSSLHGKNRVLIIEPQNNASIPELGIVVHIDTVPFDECEWKHNPLGEFTAGKIYGRGILDDKGPVILSMYALYNLKGKIKDSWQIIIGSSEEDEWVDMEAFLTENPILPKFLVTIDGDGVLNGCRGYTDFVLKFKRESDTCYLTNFLVPNGVKNTVPSKAIAKLQGFIIEGSGIEVHSSIPEQGKSAITDLAQNIKQHIPEVYQEYAHMFDFLSKLHSTCNESVLGLPLQKDEHGIGTSVSATTAKMVNDTIWINLNIRIGLGKTEKDIENAVHYLKTQYKCDIEVLKLIMPSYVDSNQKEFLAMQDAYEKVIFKKPTVTIARGLGYNAALPNCAIFGPRFDTEDDLEPDSCHQADECRSIESLFKFYEMLNLFLSKIL